jgi:hypothetical protein
MFKSMMREPFPAHWKTAIATRLGSGSSKQNKEMLELALPAAACVCLLLYWLKSASVESYVSVLM